MTQAVKAVWAVFIQEKERRRRIHIGTRLSLMLYAKMRRQISKQRGVDMILKNRLRYSFSVATPIMHEIYREYDILLVMK